MKKPKRPTYYVHDSEDVPSRQFLVEEGKDGNIIELTKENVRLIKTALQMEKALRWFLNTVQSTGGLIEYPDGCFAPVGDPDWIDLGEAAIAARDVLKEAVDSIKLRIRKERVYKNESY